MGRTIGLGRIWSFFVFGFRSLVARLAPFKRESEQRGRIFLARESVNSLRISSPQWWDRKCEGRNEKCDFLARESVNSQKLCEFLAWESVNSSPILARQWWRHFRLSLFLSLSLSLSHRAYLTHKIGSASALPIIGKNECCSPFQKISQCVHTFHCHNNFRPLCSPSFKWHEKQKKKKYGNEQVKPIKSRQIELASATLQLSNRRGNRRNWL